MRTQIWSIESDPEGSRVATPLPNLDGTETERLLEDLLVSSPALLAENVTIIGRQLPISGGFLDLLGLDEDGRLVIYEIKRSTLTRDAVAQVLDYGSSLNDMDLDDIARLIEEGSGHRGVDEIADFLDFYDSEHPNDRDALSKPPRLALVGLGVDDRARRMIEFLSGSGIEIGLVTFQAFDQGGNLFLTRQVATTANAKRRSQPSASSKSANSRVLKSLASSLGVEDLLENVAEFVVSKTEAYKWPGKSAYSMSLQSRTSEGLPTLHSAVVVYPDKKSPGQLLVRMTSRAKAAIGSESLSVLKLRLPLVERPDASQFPLEFTVSPESWAERSSAFAVALEALVAGWKTEVAEDDLADANKE